MSAKYLEIPINTVAASGTMDLVVNSRASSPITTGNNASLGEVSAVSAVGGTNNGGYVTATGVATTGGGNNDLTVDIIATAGSVDSIAINAAGTAYAAADTITIAGGGANATFSITAVGNLGSNANIISATGAGIGVVAGDIVYNVTAGTKGVVNIVVDDNQFNCVSTLFPLGGEVFATRKSKQLESTGATFTARKVRVGDIVKNTTAVTQTTVAALVDETKLTLTADIFDSATLYDDNFTIEPLATQVYDPSATFLTTVTTDDIIENTTTSLSGGTVSIVDDFRVTTGQANMFGDGNAYSIFDQSTSTTKVYRIDDIIGADWLSSTTTEVYLNSINANADTITITHSNQGIEGNRLVAAAIENTLVNAVLGTTTPSAVVVMPIFNFQQVVVDTIAVS
tara:strand:+ start:1323 stop:2516 length:1194 start_codon:yes stop_codon:yes gene_type:complete